MSRYIQTYRTQNKKLPSTPRWKHFSSLDEKFEFLKMNTKGTSVMGAPASELLSHRVPFPMVWIDIDQASPKQLAGWIKETFERGTCVVVPSTTTGTHIYLRVDRIPSKLAIEEFKNTLVPPNGFVDRVFSSEDKYEIYIPVVRGSSMVPHEFVKQLTKPMVFESEGIIMLKETIRNILKEGQVDDLIKKNPNIKPEVIQMLSRRDPSKRNKYVSWMIKAVKSGERPDEVLSTVGEFHRAAPRIKTKGASTDINSYKRLADIRDVLANTANTTKRDTKPDTKKAAKSGEDYWAVYEDDEWVVYRPYTQAASCRLGQGSKWCIAATQSRNYFDWYDFEDNIFYFFIKKGGDPLKNPKDKISLSIIPSYDGNHHSFDHIMKTALYDANDENFSNDVDALAEYMPNLKQARNAIEADLKKTPTTGAKQKIEAVVSEIKKGNFEPYKELPAQSRRMITSQLSFDDRLKLVNTPGIDFETVNNFLHEEFYRHNINSFNELLKKIKPTNLQQSADIDGIPIKSLQFIDYIIDVLDSSDREVVDDELARINSLANH